MPMLLTLAKNKLQIHREKVCQELALKWHCIQNVKDKKIHTHAEPSKII